MLHLYSWILYNNYNAKKTNDVEILINQISYKEGIYNNNNYYYVILIVSVILLVIWAAYYSKDLLCVITSIFTVTLFLR